MNKFENTYAVEGEKKWVHLKHCQVRLKITLFLRVIWQHCGTCWYTCKPKVWQHSIPCTSGANEEKHLWCAVGEEGLHKDIYTCWDFVPGQEGLWNAFVVKIEGTEDFVYYYPFCIHCKEFHIYGISSFPPPPEYIHIPKQLLVATFWKESWGVECICDEFSFFILYFSED